MNKFFLVIIITISFIFSFVVELNASDVCEKEEKFSQIWYINNCERS